MENQNLTTREEYISKKKQKEEIKMRQTRSKKIKKILFFLIPAVLLLAGTVFGISKIDFGGSENQAGEPKMALNPQEYDVGQVSMAAGLVKKTYEIKNEGEGDLKIENMSTSCHCTTAVLTVGDKKSSEFGMGGSSFWSQKIAPGQTGYLEVIFDPAYHGEAGTGAVIRAVWFSTNDSQNKKAEVRLAADVIH